MLDPVNIVLVQSDTTLGVESMLNPNISVYSDRFFSFSTSGARFRMF